MNIDTIKIEFMKNNKFCQVCNNSNGVLENVVDFLKIVSEPNRLKILHFLRSGEGCVCEICESLKLPQNLISHHLKTLKDFGLIKSRREGRKVIYWSNKKSIEKYASFLNNFLIFNL